MKIEKLHFKNINSLYGEWEIDFTQPEYTQNGLFVITGPTGSGKSSIFDVLCLALFGATARISVKGKENDAFSLGKHEFLAEAVILLDAGRFRFRFEQTRSKRKNSLGNLQSCRRIIYQGENVYAEGNSASAKAAEQLLGMDLEQFLRTVMLAQGRFTAFLESGENDRAMLLENITGTGIYRDISKEVFLRAKNEEEVRRHILDRLNNIQQITPDSREQLLQQSADLEKTLLLLQQERQEYADLCALFDQYTKNTEALHQQQLHEKELFLEEQSFQKDALRLKLAENALECESAYLSREELIRTQASHQKNLQQAEDQAQQLKDQTAETEKHLLHATEQFALFQEQEKKLMPLLQQVRTLKTREEEKKVLLRKTETDLSLSKQECLAQQNLLEKLNKQARQDAAELQDTLLYLEQHAKDAQIESVQAHLTSCRDMLVYTFRNGLTLYRRQNETTSHMTQLRQKISEIQQDLQSRHAQSAETEAAQKQLQTQIQTLLQGQTLQFHQERLQSALREQTLLARIAGYEEERRLLKKGIPCPLCGSLEHPYAEKHPSDEQSVLAQKISGLQKRLEDYQSLEKRRKELDSLSQQAETEKIRQENALQNFQQQLAALQSQYLQNQTEQQSIEKQIL